VPRPGQPRDASATAGAELRGDHRKIVTSHSTPDGAVTLSVIDDRERIRTPVLLPTVVANTSQPAPG